MIKITPRAGNVFAATLLGVSLLGLPVWAAETNTTDQNTTGSKANDARANDSKSGAAPGSRLAPGSSADAKAAEATRDTNLTTAKTGTGMTEEDMRAADRRDVRMRHMHDRLHITAAQEDKWSAVVKVMAENETAGRNRRMDSNREDRRRDDREETRMSAVDNLKAMQVHADDSAANLKKIIPPVEALYTSLSPDQQKRADQMFSHRDRRDRGNRDD